MLARQKKLLLAVKQPATKDLETKERMITAMTATTAITTIMTTTHNPRARVSPAHRPSVFLFPPAKAKPNSWEPAPCPSQAQPSSHPSPRSKTGQSPAYPSTLPASPVSPLCSTAPSALALPSAAAAVAFQRHSVRRRPLD